MQIRTGVYWSVGARRGKNQDSLSLQHVRLRRGDTLLAIVCDGIGGLDFGEEASSIVVRRMTYWFYHEYRELLLSRHSKDDILIALQRQIKQIQEILQTIQKEQTIQTGTTFTGILFFKKYYILMHIGDSRIYQIRKKIISIGKKGYKTVCLTKDDHNEAGYLTKCLGAGGKDRIHLETGHIRRGSGFLICTDGFYKGLTKSLIGQIYGPILHKRSDITEQLERRLEMLGNYSERAGIKDNKAAIGIIIGGKE